MKAPDEMPIKDQEQLKMEIQYIFDSGANEIRIFEMVKLFIKKRYSFVQPIEQPAEKEQPSDEDIEKWAKTHAKRCSSDIYHIKLIEATSIIAMKAMRDSNIKSQSSPAMSPKPTNDVIGFDVLKRNSDIAFDQTIKAVKESMSPKPQEEITAWTRSARCKDCIFLVAHSPNGHTKRHYCSNPESKEYNKSRTLKDLVCDKWKII